MKIAIRVDGGPNIGLGHIHRCLALASRLKKREAEIFFISQENKDIKGKIEQQGFTVLELKNNLNLEEDLKSTIEVIKERKINIVITDSYAIDENYLTEITKIVSILVSIDDLAKFPFSSDIVINQNIFAKDLNYRSSTGKIKFLLGPRYALLREEFVHQSGRCILQGARRKISKKVRNILVTLGGSDFFNLMPKILDALDKLQADFNITVIIGSFFINISEIEKTIMKMNKRVNIVCNPPQMANLMLSSDLAIAGGGTTLYELAATGTPALAFCLADNQYKNVKGMAKFGTLINMGWGNKWQEERIYKEINKLISNYPLREKMSKLGQKLVDGRGSLVSAKEILSLYSFKIR